MRWIIFFWTAVMLFATIPAAGAAEIDGFRGFKWGTEYATLNSAEFIKVPPFKGISPGVDVYQRKNDDLRVVDVEVDNINYNFRKGRLVSVNIDFKGFTVYEALMANCKNQFGQATSSMPKNMEILTSFESPKTHALLYFQLGSPQYSFGRMFLYSRDFFN